MSNKDMPTLSELLELLGWDYEIHKSETRSCNLVLLFDDFSEGALLKACQNSQEVIDFVCAKDGTLASTFLDDTLEVMRAAGLVPEVSSTTEDGFDLASLLEYCKLKEETGELTCAPAYDSAKAVIHSGCVKLPEDILDAFKFQQ